jgi:hypothetical protein
MSHRTGLSRGVLLLALLCAVSFGAIVRVALAGDNNHVACVEHGFYSGSSNTDGSFFSRVYAGCGSSDRYCALIDGSNPSHWVLFGSTETYNTTGTCNTWSSDYGSYQECTAVARVNDPGVFSQHDHGSAGGC